MFDALVTIAIYAAIGVGLLYGAVFIAVVGALVWDRVAGESLGYDELNDYLPLEDWSAWEDWTPNPDDQDRLSDDDEWGWPR